MRTLASIQRITDLRSIEGADKIEVATVLGWQVVVKKGEFKKGDLCVYFEIDSLLPIRQKYAFLQSGGVKNMLVDGKTISGYRIKTIRLRGQISQGLCLPLSIVPTLEKIVKSIDIVNKFPADAPSLAIEGTDLTDVLGVHKYEIPTPAELSGKVRGNFPDFFPKTDESRLQAYPWLLDKYKNESFYVTEKIDGSSCSFVIKNGDFHVCSRNLDLLDDGKNSLWRLAKEMHIEEKLRSLGEEQYVIQGEIFGEGIQGNPLKIKGQQIRFFNVYDFIKGDYANYDTTCEVLQKLDLPMVPVLIEPEGCVSWSLRATVDEMVQLSRVKSAINPDEWVEGVVWRPIDEEIQDPKLGRLSFKVVNPEYLLKHE